MAQRWVFGETEPVWAWLGPHQLAKTLQQEAGDGPQISGGLWKESPTQCHKTKKIFKKCQIQFVLPTLIIENLIYWYYEVIVFSGLSGLLVFSVITPAICMLAAHPEALCGGLTLPLQGCAS